LETDIQEVESLAINIGKFIGQDSALVDHNVQMLMENYQK